MFYLVDACNLNYWTEETNAHTRVQIQEFMQASSCITFKSPALSLCCMGIFSDLKKQN